MQRLSAITHIRFGLFRFRSPLLTESRLFSFPVGTEMFHFPTFPPTALYIQAEVAGHDSGTFKVSLFGNPRITARLPAPQGLSQVTTSFIGSWCLGIHRSHLVACSKKYLQRCSRPLCSSQNTGEPGTTTPQQGTSHRSAQSNPSPKQPTPQDPTACSRNPPPNHPHVPLPHNRGCTCTDNRHQASPANVPQFHKPTRPGTNAPKPGKHGPAPTGTDQEGSLERR